MRHFRTIQYGVKVETSIRQSTVKTNESRVHVPATIRRYAIGRVRNKVHPAVHVHRIACMEIALENGFESISEMEMLGCYRNSSVDVAYVSSFFQVVKVRV